jgi:hypothetical protein
MGSDTSKKEIKDNEKDFISKGSPDIPDMKYRGNENRLQSESA